MIISLPIDIAYRGRRKNLHWYVRSLLKNSSIAVNWAAGDVIAVDGIVKLFVHGGDDAALLHVDPAIISDDAATHSNWRP